MKNKNNFFESIFDNKFEELRPERLDIDSFVGESESFLFIVGDFFGIQKFIFDAVSTKNAAKILRAKSAYIQIFTKVLAHYLREKLGEDGSLILSTSAGKFEILSKNKNTQAILDDTQKKINKKFINEFYALGGIGISFTECEKADLYELEKYKKLKECIVLRAELAKCSKFDLQNQNPALQYEDGIDNQTLCGFCNLRKKSKDKDTCSVCETFIAIGKELTTKQSIKISRNFGKYKIFESYYVAFDDKKDENTVEIFDISKNKTGKNTWALSSYVYSRNGDIATFEELEADSEGLKAIGVLKGDVDGMGEFVKSCKSIGSLQDFYIFSKSIDNFFSFYVPKIAQQNYANTYTVFAGGDDLFLMGAWNETLELAIKIQRDFLEFTRGALMLSFGFITAKSGTPMPYLANTVEKALESAKNIDEHKDAITAFGETVKRSSYINARDILYQELEKLPQEDKKTAFLYSLLTFCEMSKKVKYDCDIRETMWKSKLRYSFTRNMDTKYESLLNIINYLIENNPKETKMCIVEAIYKKRTDKSE